MNAPSRCAPLNVFDRLQMLLLVISFTAFRAFIRKYYLARKLYDPAVYNEKHVFFLRNGKRLSRKFKCILAENGYPETSLDFDLLVEKLRSGCSLSRFGDGEYAIIKGKTNSRIYFDRATRQAKHRLLQVLQEPIDNHLLGMIHPDVVVNQLSFVNVLSAFNRVSSTGLRCRMPMFAEYDEESLQIYRRLKDSPRPVFETGSFRNTSREQQERLWEGKDILYVIGSVRTIEKYDISLKEIFRKANSFEMMETVTEFALSEHYDEILERLLSHPDLSNKMILLSQGMAGTVLAYDLAKRGYHAIDLGQPFIYYRSKLIK